MAKHTTRRDILKGVPAAAGGMLICANGPALSAPRKPSTTGGSTLSPYRAFVRRSLTGTVETITPKPLTGRQVAVRTQACFVDYSNARLVLDYARPVTVGGPPVGGGPRPTGMIPGDSNLGVVEAIGPQVQSVKVGDRVVIAVTAECGRCHNCLRGRADRCATFDSPAMEIATLADGTPVVQQGGGGGKGGFAEMSIVNEELCVPIFTDLPSTELAILPCAGTTGLGLTMTLAPVDAGSNVVIFGAGPVGLSAVQGARIQGAHQIIVVEPIAARRTLALKVGATAAIDPNIDTDTLVPRLREMCKGPTDRIFAGAAGSRSIGPDFVIEASGGDHFPPKAEKGPDPTGILAVQQAWDLCPPGGHLLTTAVGYPADAKVSFPAGIFTNGSKTVHSSQYGGSHSRRDIPRYVRLIEKGLFDAKSLVTSVYSLDQIKEAHQETVDRTGIAGVITFA